MREPAKKLTDAEIAALAAYRLSNPGCSGGLRPQVVFS
jgi:hypothetical protein